MARDRLEIFQHATDEALIGVDLKIERIRNTAHEPDRLFAVTPEKCIVAAGLASDDGVFEAGIGISLHETQWI